MTCPIPTEKKKKTSKGSKQKPCRTHSHRYRCHHVIVQLIVDVKFLICLCVCYSHTHCLMNARLFSIERNSVHKPTPLNNTHRHRQWQKTRQRPRSVYPVAQPGHHLLWRIPDHHCSDSIPDPVLPGQQQPKHVGCPDCEPGRGAALGRILGKCTFWTLHP